MVVCWRESDRHGLTAEEPMVVCRSLGRCAFMRLADDWKQVNVMWRGFAKGPDRTALRRLGAYTHVHGLAGKPNRIHPPMPWPMHYHANRGAARSVVPCTVLRPESDSVGMRRLEHARSRINFETHSQFP